jgi:hypothetical protein
LDTVDLVLAPTDYDIGSVVSRPVGYTDYSGSLYLEVVVVAFVAVFEAASVVG